MNERSSSFTLFFLSAGMEQHEVLGDLVADVQVDDPVHEVEAGEGDGEEDAAVLVDPHGGVMCVCFYHTFVS